MTDERTIAVTIEQSCMTCASCLWYGREDGSKTLLCIKGQPEESVRVTLDVMTCEGWKAK